MLIGNLLELFLLSIKTLKVKFAQFPVLAFARSHLHDRVIVFVSLIKF